MWTNSSMKKLMSLWNILALMAFEGNTQEVKMDPGMREGQPSYIYCDIGTVTEGVTFYTEQANVQGNCLAPTADCSSVLYTLTQNTTGALLQIATVDVSRDEGEWYCQHGTDRSSNTISLNNHTIAGFLLRSNWTESTGPVDIFTAVLTLSCSNRVPEFNFTFEDSESNTGTVPPEAVSTTTQSVYDGTTCENGNKFYVIILSARHNLDVFNNKTGVKFSFNYYGTFTIAPFSVDFLAFFAELTTESPTTGVTDGLGVGEKVGIGLGVGVPAACISGVLVWSWKKKKWVFKEKEDKQTTKKKEKPSKKSSDTTEMGELKSAKRENPPSPKVGHADDKSTSSVSSVNPEIMQQ